MNLRKAFSSSSWSPNKTLGCQVRSQLGEKTPGEAVLMLARQADGSTYLVFSNPYAAKIFSVPEVRIGEAFAWHLMPGEVGEYVRRVMLEPVAPDPESLPLLELQDPEERAFEARVSQVEVEGILFVYFGFTEVTRWLHLQEEFMNGVRLESIGVLTSGIAHELNNLLTVVQGNASLLQMNLEGDPSSQESLRTIIQACANGAVLTRSLLNYARKQTLQMSEMDLGQMVADMIKLVRPAYGGRYRFELQIHRGDSGLKVFGCYAVLCQLFLNLLNNARDAMPEGGTISIEVFSDRGSVALRVKDQGAGIDPSIMDQIFTPFFTTKEKGKGTGLGLSMVRDVVRQHGGSIDVDSPPGEGACFTLRLPLFRPEFEEQAAVEKSMATDYQCFTLKHPGASLAFVLDDEALVAEAMGKLLRLHRLEVCLFSNASDALVAMAQGQSPSILIVDLQMPEMNGIEFIRHAHAIMAARGLGEITRFVMVSGGDLAEAESQLKDVPGLNLGCVSKPLTMEQIEQFIGREILRRYRRTTHHVHLSVLERYRSVTFAARPKTMARHSDSSSSGS